MPSLYHPHGWILTFSAPLVNRIYENTPIQNPPVVVFTGDMSTTTVGLLKAASDVLGGPKALAEQLGISEAMLSKYLADNPPLPDGCCCGRWTSSSRTGSRLSRQTVFR
jgi:hypothetical protein